MLLFAVLHFLCCGLLGAVALLGAGGLCRLSDNPDKASDSSSKGSLHDEPTTL